MISRVFLLIVYVSVASSGKILYISSVPSHSHVRFHQSMWKELSLRGHQVVALTPVLLDAKNLINLTQIEIPGLKEIVAQHGDRTTKLSNDNFFFDVATYAAKYYGKLTEAALCHLDDIFANHVANFDLIIVEMIHPLLNGVVCRFKAPLVGILSTELPTYIYETLGNPTHPSLYAETSQKLNPEVNFLERVSRVLYSIIMPAVVHYIMPQIDKKSKKHFGDTCPYIEDITKDVRLVLTNTNPFIHQIRPRVPVFVEMAGLAHIQPPQPLPKDLQTFLDENPQGVIYFSLGSNIKSFLLPNTTINIILQALAELPYKVLWKWELATLSNKPPNVMIKPWFPQQDILRHKNIKAFITQGGIQSIEEAIVNRVPIIGIPFFLDQAPNIRSLIAIGVAQGIDHKSMTKNDLKNAILEVAGNNKYKEAMCRVSELMRDQSIRGLDKAAWWIEYIMKHKGAVELKNSAAYLPGYEYMLLDVFAVILVMFSIILYLTSVVVKFLIKSAV